MPPPLVKVTWEDACCLDIDQRWVEHGKHEYKPVIVESVGFLLYDGKEGVILTAAWNENQIGPRDQIPRGMVRKVVKLKS